MIRACVECSLGDVFAARNRNLDDHVARRAVKAGGLANRRFDHPAGNRMIAGSPGGSGRPARVTVPMPLRRGTPRPSRRAVRHARDDQRAMGDVRSSPASLMIPCAREVLAKPSNASAKLGRAPPGR